MKTRLFFVLSLFVFSPLKADQVEFKYLPQLSQALEETIAEPKQYFYPNPENEYLDIVFGFSFYRYYDSKIRDLCPGYVRHTHARKSSDFKYNRIFWNQLFISLSYFESKFKKNAVGKETWGGENYGLFQINPVTEKDFYRCKKAKKLGWNPESGKFKFSLFDPEDNIRCALKITAVSMNRHKTFLGRCKKGIAYYFGPLRANDELSYQKRVTILEHVKRACRMGEVTTSFDGNQDAVLAEFKDKYNFKEYQFCKKAIDSGQLL